MISQAEAAEMVATGSRMKLPAAACTEGLSKKFNLRPAASAEHHPVGSCRWLTTGQTAAGKQQFHQGPDYFLAQYFHKKTIRYLGFSNKDILVNTG
jgi:hypothetical protein